MTVQQWEVVSCGSWSGWGLLVSMTKLKGVFSFTFRSGRQRFQRVLKSHRGICTHEYYPRFQIVLFSGNVIFNNLTWTSEGLLSHIHSVILSSRSSHLSPKTAPVQTVPLTSSRQVPPPNYGTIAAEAAAAVSISVLFLFHSLWNVPSPFHFRCLLFILEMA